MITDISECWAFGSYCIVMHRKAGGPHTTKSYTSIPEIKSTSIKLAGQDFFSVPGPIALADFLQIVVQFFDANAFHHMISSETFSL